MRRVRLLAVLTVFMAPLALAASGAGPRPQASRTEPQVIGGLAFKGKIEVTVVNLDVFVRDRKGAPVTGLGPEDFVVVQDGQPRTVTNFTAYELGAQPAPVAGLPAPTAAADAGGTGTAEEAADPTVTVAIFVDNEHLRPVERNRILLQLRRFLPKLMGGTVRAMVVSYQRSLRIEQPLTTDRAAVSRALRDLRRRQTGLSEPDMRRKELLRSLLNMQENDPRRTSGQGGLTQMDLMSRLRSYAESMDDELTYTINAMRQVISSISGLPGRKVVLHVSSGLPMMAGKDLFNLFSTVFQRTSTLSLSARFDRRGSWNALAAAANAQGVSLYTVDAAGLGTGGSVSAEYSQRIDPITEATFINNNQQTLELLAEKTGGRAILNANDVTEGLGRLREDLFAYYSLGYTIGATGADTVHTVEVRAPGHPGYEVRYRRTFVERSLETRVQDKVTSALLLDVNENPMRLEASTGQGSPAPEGRWLVPLEVRVPLASIALLPEGEAYIGNVVLFVAARDRSGRQSDLQRTEHTIRVRAADYPRLRDERYAFDLKLLMEGGPSRLAVALLDRTTRQVSFVTLSQKLRMAD